jgi:hypothetical protein
MLLGMSTSRVSRFAAAVFVAALALTACAAEKPDDASASGSSASGSGEHSTDDSTPSATEEPGQDDALQVSVSVQDGDVDPPTQRVEVQQGQQVQLTITSDVDDEVHVHGFDVEGELQAGQPTTLEFVADQTGLFEVETHETELLLLQLEIR